MTAAEMGLEVIKARIQRLERLAHGFAVEVGRLSGGGDQLLYVERKTYQKAIREALAGVEEARVVLAKVVQRLEGWMYGRDGERFTPRAGHTPPLHAERC